MQYAVPQFIDVESKIIGPIAVRQFIMIAIAAALIFLFFKYADFGMFIFATAIIVIFTIVFAFVKINGRPFHYFVLNISESIRTPRLQVWQKEIHEQLKNKSQARTATPKSGQINYVRIAKQKEKTQSRLSDLSLLVDTGGYYSHDS